MRRIITPLLLAVAIMFGLTACNAEKTYASQCAYQIGSGAGDSHQIKDVIYPGEKVDVGDDIVRFVPCNSRNFIITAREGVGDRHEAVAAKTAASKDKPATPVSVYLSAYWALNQDEAALKAFLPFCEKYRCFADENQVSGNENFSTEGWNGMLRENFSFALDRAVADAVVQFPPNVWEDRSQWAAVADKVSNSFADQIRKATGSSYDFFCASGSARGECAPVRITIDDIVPPQYVKDQKDKAVEVTGEGDLNTARLNKAKSLYGPNANYFLGLQDTIAECKREPVTQCLVILGNGADTNVTVPAPQ